MDYELVSAIKPIDKIWQTQKQRLIEKNGKVISLSPSPNFNQLKKIEGVEGINLLDELTKREYHPDNFLFFNQIPTAVSAEVFMNEDRSISVINDGTEIARVATYPETRRHVKEVKYLNSDNTTDFIEEYADDGQLYSNIFFFNDKVHEIDFYNSKQFPIIQYFFYEGQINLVVVRDQNTGKVTNKYSSLVQFLTDQVANRVTEKDNVSISYMGLELFALEKTKSRNVLYLTESPLTGTGCIKGNLLSILENKIPYIQEVKMSREHYNKLVGKNVCLDKVTKID
ncbi:hypothetical protein KQI58_17600 [Enterococcus raffinosus]|uniref:hypothetical protein n=1 Tax=Enterococcus raffinosus TaxID=71452 RepID=UPI001C103EB1|nr:hypothetical protein [Enterococcus raffinosus]MBU5362868.1 hypothetical protein [Enterococcus raffinosus]